MDPRRLPKVAVFSALFCHGRYLRCGPSVAALALLIGCGSTSADDCAVDRGCPDADCDTICDADEGEQDRDTDHDGVPNYLDIDADGDGITDLREAGDEDLLTAPYDRDENGVPDFLDRRYPLQAWPDVPGPDAGAGGGAAGRASEPPDAGEPPSGPLLDCPTTPDDWRLPEALRPYGTYQLDAREFYSGPAALGIRWQVTGGPCDAMHAAQDPGAAEAGLLSYELGTADRALTTLRPSLSGRYTVSLTVETAQGPLACSWDIDVLGDGLRVQVCWPQTGPAMAAQAVDFDLHLGREDRTLAWGSNADCHVSTCIGAQTPWAYPDSPSSACEGSRLSAEATGAGPCPNPRLDSFVGLDQASLARYRTEQVSLDTPRPGERFRIAVDYAAAAAGAAATSPPLVLVYCGGTLAGRFGGEGAATPAPQSPGQRWRVADVEIGRGGARATCELSGLLSQGAQGGQWLSGAAATAY